MEYKFLTDADKARIKGEMISRLGGKIKRLESDHFKLEMVGNTSDATKLEQRITVLHAEYEEAETATDTGG